MDEIKKILQLVANGDISPEDAETIFDRWKEQGKQIVIDSTALNHLSKNVSKPVTENKSEVINHGDEPVNLTDILSAEMTGLIATIFKINPNQVSLAMPIKNYGIDSVSASQITMHFKDKYQLQITPPMLYEVRSLLEYIEQLINLYRPQLANYHNDNKEVISDVVIPILAQSVSDVKQDALYSKDEALFEGKQDFETMWSKIEHNVLDDKKIEPKIPAVEMPEGQSILVSLNKEVVELINFGKGEPLLLIGGLGSNYSMWQFLLPSLATHYKIIVYYPPGHGKSTISQSKSKISDIAELLHECLLQMNISNPIHVVGHSSGGSIALELAINFPKLVKSLTLISTSSKVNRQEDAFEKSLSEFEKIKTTFPNPSELFPYITPEVTNYFKQVYQNYDSTKLLSSIHAPTLIISGDEDEFIPIENSIAIQNEIGSSGLVTIMHAGHFAVLTHAEIIYKKMKHFYDRID